MMIRTTFDDIFVWYSDIKVEVTCQTAVFHSHRIEEHVNHLLGSTKKDSNMNEETATSKQPAIPWASPDTLKSSSSESNVSSDDSNEVMVVPE